ncbi:MAG: T9SS type A sorting domain-containing protein, partial [Bacteroidales bacterium]
EYIWFVVDANGCDTPVEFELVQPEELEASHEATEILCYGDLSTVTVSAIGGTAPYRLFDGETLVATFEAGEVVSLELGAGAYSWTVTDANNCGPVVIAFALVNPDPIVLDIEAISHVLCHGDAAGVIQAAAMGGTGALTYSLNGGEPQDNGLFEGLLAGEYVVTVMDENGCSLDSDVIVINEPEPLVLTILNSTNATCDGRKDGTITYTISGGVGPYNVCLITECIDNGDNDYQPFDKSQGGMYWGLQPGWYMIKVVDQNGCEVWECVYIGINEIVVDHIVESACETSAATVNFLNPGLENVDVNAFAWSATDAMVNSNLSSLQILGGAATVTAYRNFANGTLGQITHRGTRGIGINGGTGDEVDGQERMVVEFDEAVYLSSFVVRSLFIEGNPAQAEQGKALLYLDGMLVDDIQLIAVQPTGGVGELTTNLPVAVKVDRMEFFVPQGESYSNFSEFALAKITIAEVVELVNIILDVDGDAGPFTYIWSNGATTKDLMGVAPGSYSVLIIDENNCTKMYDLVAEASCDDFEIPGDDVADNDDEEDKVEDPLTDNNLTITESISVRTYPNPFVSETTVEFTLMETSSVSLEVYNLVGERVAVLFQGTANALETYKYTFRADALPNGIYLFRLTAGDKVYHDRVILSR